MLDTGLKINFHPGCFQLLQKTLFEIPLEKYIFESKFEI